jgi:hypothetical protein
MRNLSSGGGLHRRGNRNFLAGGSMPTSFEFGSRPFNQGLRS